jgi:hypothetical protein
MKFKLLVTAILLSTSQFTNAATISYNGYSIDTTTDIVTAGRTEWLQWDETKGMSISSALTAYASDGWRLASNLEMLSLMNSFFGSGWTQIDNESKINRLSSYTEDDIGTVNYTFLQMFGITRHEDAGKPSIIGGEIYYTPFEYTSAYYGSDEDSDGLYKRVRVINDYKHGTPDCDQTTSGCRFNTDYGSISSDFVTLNRVETWDGVALVRINPIPVPAAVWLFSSGLIGIAMFGVRVKINELLR